MVKQLNEKRPVQDSNTVNQVKQPSANTAKVNYVSSNKTVPVE